MPPFTLCIPYYSQPCMLRRHMQEWPQYPGDVTVILVDDGSPIPALPALAAALSPALAARVRLYRILQDVPWNREEARNLAAHEAETAYILQTDIDHILPAASAAALVQFVPAPRTWYRFPRWRVGAADATRRKDQIPDACTFGRIHPHGDSFFMERQLFLESPYDEAYGGMLGGGTPFLRRMEARAPWALLPETIALHVYTRHVIPDASVTGLSRDTRPYAHLRKTKERLGETEPGRILRLAWERQW